MRTKIEFKKGIDNRLFWLTYFYYRPFLNKKYAEVEMKYTVYCGEKVQGQICLDTSEKIPSIQICLLPYHTVKGVDVVFAFMDKFNLRKIQWCFHKHNYLSMLLLAKLGGYIEKVEDDVCFGYVDRDLKVQTIDLKEQLEVFL